MPQGIRRPRLCSRLRHIHRNRGGGVELGRPDGDKTVLPVIPDSYEYVCHDTGTPSFVLNLHRSNEMGLRKPRFERAIGVIYRPETELASHYFQAILPEQFDEYVWFDETRAITPFETKTLKDLPDTYRFGL